MHMNIIWLAFMAPENTTFILKVEQKTSVIRSVGF